MGPTAARPLRVVSVPAGHPYVRHLSIDAPDASRVIRLADPIPDAAEPTRWWPPVVLDPSWIRANAREFDVLHVHFGTESFSASHLAAVLDALRDAGLPLVSTVHDLEHPQLLDQAAHTAHLDVLVPAAAEVITLTSGAAAEIARRWNRVATVIPHPNVLPLDAAFPEVEETPQLIVGVHLRDLRPNIDGPGTVTTLLAAVRRLRAAGVDASARVLLNERVRDLAARDEVRAVVAADGQAELLEHPRLSDDALAASLAGLDVAVLPYRHGTHSGWVELCFDLGVPVAGPRVGFAAEQHLDHGFFAPFESGDAASLAQAIRQLTSDDDRDAVRRSRRAARALDRVAIDDAHLAVYERAVAGR